ncbi:MAG: hypothetical protein ACSLEN_07340 [Candidatus Malihini olakiniferum]
MQFKVPQMQWQQRRETKGVIWSSTTPGVDKRLAQNLWMNTANNANTPMR